MSKSKPVKSASGLGTKDNYLVKKVNQINNERRASLGRVSLPLLHDEASPPLGDIALEISDVTSDRAIITTVVQVHRETLDVLPDTSMEESEQAPPVTTPVISCRKLQSKRGGKHSKKRVDPPRVVVCNGPIPGPCPVDGNKEGGTLVHSEQFALLVRSKGAKIEAKMEDLLRPLTIKLDTVSLEVDRLSGLVSAYLATAPAAPPKVVDKGQSARRENVQQICQQVPATEPAPPAQQLATDQNRQPIVESEGRPDFKHIRKSRYINLPPDCAPYVAVLTNVPPIDDFSAQSHGESHDSLKNKTVAWLSKNCGFPTKYSDQILSTRRVNWIGPSDKTTSGDCIVVNFKHPQHVATVLLRAASLVYNENSVYVCPLGYFYAHLIVAPLSL
ncbi:uncharacterized protein LOC144792420 [Lissotriton helveticus]